MWAAYALLSAFFVATTDPIAKRALKGADEYLIGWGLLVFSTPFLAVFYLSHPIAPLNPALIKTLLFIVPFEILATVLYYRALKLTDISLSVPFLALTPVFVIITAFLFLGESIRPSGVIGILFITAGAYSLNIKEAKYSLMHPIKAIFRNKGSLYMVIVALIFSLTATISKKAMLLSSPESVPFIYNMAISIAMAPLILYRLKNHKIAPIKDYRSVIPYIALGFLSALSAVFFYKSIALENVAYAISIKRLSLVMSVGYGWMFFKERDMHIRMPSALCMFLGVIIIFMNQ